MALAQVAQATQPACIHELGEVYQHHRPLLPVGQDTTPVAMSPFRRQYPREEPGALAAHAGICAGGGEQSSSLPRPMTHEAGTQLLQGLMRRATRPEPERAGKKVLLVDELQHHDNRPLTYLILECWKTERPERSIRLRNICAPD